MIQASLVPLAKKSCNRSVISAGVLEGARISTAKSGAPGKNCFAERLNPFRRALEIKEISGARQLRLRIQKPVLESQTAPSLCALAKVRDAVRSSAQMSPWV